MIKGFIVIHRKLINWGWWEDHNTTRLFLYLLLRANWQKGEWKGIEIDRGELVTGRKKLSQGTGLSEQQIRTSLSNLQSTNEITIKSTKKYSIITVCNYGRYQDEESNEQPSNQPSEQPQINQQITTNKQLKNKNNTNTTKKRNIKEKKVKVFVPPSLDEVKIYFKENGYREEFAIRAWKYYDAADWHDKNGDAVKNWKQKMIANWFKEDSKEKERSPTFNETGSKLFGTR